MTSPSRTIFFFVLATAWVVTGCDETSPADGGVDSGAPDAGVREDAGDVDAGPRDGGIDASVLVELRGTVFVEDAVDRTLDGGVTPWPDGGMPDGAVVTPGGRVVGASVFLKTLAGATIDTATTDGDGAYALTGPADTLTFLHVEPRGGYAGQIRAEMTRGADYPTYDLVLPEEAGLDDAMSSVGITRDVSRGLIACGFNPVNDQAGGDGAELGAGITHDPAFNLTDMGSILGNRLVPLCLSDGSNPPGALPGATCTENVRARQVFFPNVMQSRVPVTPLNPASGTCSLRFSVSEWLTAPNSMTVVNIDCVP